MGCSSSTEDIPEKGNKKVAGSPKDGSSASDKNVSTSERHKSMKEEQIKLAFKAKKVRVNVFNQSLDNETRRQFVPPTIPKTKDQDILIR